MTEWMGRYRPLVAALVHHVNCVSKQGPPQFIYEDIYLTPNEWQVLEYIVEHREDDQHMINMSEALAIPQISFSKLIEKLCKDGLIERYRLAGNKKNIILKPTPLAVTAYEFHTAELYQKMFQPFFDQLECFADEELERFTHAINVFSSNAIQLRGPAEKKKQPLIKLDR